MKPTSEEPEVEAARFSTVGRIPHLYRAIVESDDGRFYSEVPALPGCHSWGYTCEEALENFGARQE